MDTASKIYVAGHSGLVGSAISRCLEKKGYKNLIYKRSRELDLRRQADTEKFFEKERPEYVFFAAARVGGILANNTYKAEFIYDNLAIASNVINSACKYGVKKLLNLGSSCIYPKFAPQPMKEEYLLTGPLEPTNEPYAIAKISAIKLCRYYNEQYGTNFISVMPTNLYGPNDNFNLETAHVLPALIRKFHLARLLMKEDLNDIRKDLRTFPIGFGLDEKVDINDETSIKDALNAVGIESGSVTLWGTGSVFREFLYVDDLADACIFLMNNCDASWLRAHTSTNDYFINVGAGVDVRLGELAEIVREITGFKGKIRYDSSKPDGTPKKLLDVSRLKSLGWDARTSLREGIVKTCKWFVENQK